MIVSLAWPDKLLWPNGGHGNHFAVSRAKKRARHDASWSAIAARTQQGMPDLSTKPIPVTIRVYAKPRGPLPDRDNCIASLKVQLDAIAEQIGVNDRDFASPDVVFADRRDGRIEVIIGPVENAVFPSKSASSGESHGLKQSGPKHRANGVRGLTTNRLAEGGD